MCTWSEGSPATAWVESGGAKPISENVLSCRIPPFLPAIKFYHSFAKKIWFTKKIANKFLHEIKTFKRTVSQDFLLLVFFMNQFPPQPQSIPLGPFQIFSKIRRDIRKSRCTTDINVTGGKFATSVNDKGCKLPLVSTTPAANLSPVSMTLAANFFHQFC